MSGTRENRSAESVEIGKIGVLSEIRGTREVMEELGAVPNYVLAPLTSIKIGGPADWFLSAESADDVAVMNLIAKGRGLPVTIMGNGSNLLVSDRGVRGVVIRMEGGLAAVTEVGGGLLNVGAGVRLPELAKFFRDQNAGGLEWGFGVPGCVGGAIYMNAGTSRGEMKDIVESVFVIGRGGIVKEIPAPECHFAYRTSRFQRTGEIIVGAMIRMADRPYDASGAEESLRYRKTTQPLDQPNCGSVFRNPPGTTAGQLIESVGLKGYRIGNAQISPKHANFIVNLGGARAVEVRDLMNLARERVRESHGIELISEVRLFGDWGDDGRE
ncbi:MAG: UDP-N-acetylmuramate dehydrogenase [Candidatus Hydrogenedentota bacterium]|nr:MAG: UDP-N-acetylmuramate dehydrogenase [Candidatus Hydrogenedentota bacterium]